MLRHLKKYISENKGLLFWGVITLMALDLLQILTPYFMGKTIDELSKKGSTGFSVVNLISVILAMQVFIFLFRNFMRLFLNKAVVNIEYKIRTDYFKKLETLDSTFYLDNKTGDLMARATNDINSVTLLFSDGIITFVDSIFMSIIILSFMFYTMGYKITLISISPLFLIPILGVIFSPFLSKVFKNRNSQFGKLSEKAREFFSGIKVIKSYANERQIYNIFKLESKDLFDKNMKVAKVFGIMEPLIVSVTLFTLATSIFVGGTAVFDNVISVGTFVALLFYISKITWPFMAIGFLTNIVQSGIASLNRINYIFDQKSYISEKISNIEIEKFKGNIKIKDLSFSYKDNIVPTLKHINFEVKAGETIGIIGKTGSGKSTLANLLVRLENTPENSIFIDDIDITKIEISSLRKNISYAMQNSIMFSDTIKNNVTLKSLNNYSDDKLIKSTKFAKFHSEIKKMKNEYDEIIGEKGVNLSGGQKQRLNIARTILKNAPILIFDDSLSSLDNKTQLAIIKSFNTELKDKTVFIISHRISSIESADKILVMDNGFLVDIGTHNELINKNGLYKELYNIQNIENRILEYGVKNE
ncbi:MAG: hypothetical protein CSB15_01340 [Clostridiales bacterium]|nr:MAG: hypothetical protein CSB15_01340 [Clostridiales bacterium]